LKTSEVRDEEALEESVVEAIDEGAKEKDEKASE
jgi:hypothetical protein